MLGAIAAPLVAAAPVIEKRALSANDTNTLQLALYLEHLEYALYSGGYAAFSEAQYEADGFPSGFRDNVGVIASVSCSRLSHLLTESIDLHVHAVARSYARCNHHRRP